MNAEHDAAVVGLASEERELLGIVRQFCVERLRPELEEIDRTDRWFGPLLEELAELGLQGIMFDEDGTVLRERLRVAEAAGELIASYCPAMGLALNGARMQASILAELATEGLRTRWFEQIISARAFGAVAISEPEAGSDIRNLRTTACRDGDEWVLSGAKSWITLAPVADVLFVLAKVEVTDRDADMGVFAVERGMPGLSFGEQSDLIGYRGLPMSEVYLDNVVVAPSHVVVASGGLRTILEILNVGRIGAASLGAGIITGCLRHSAGYTNERIAFGRPLADLQAVQLRAAEMALDLQSARGLIRAAIDTYVAGAADEILAALAKMHAARAATAAAASAVEMAGAMGLSREFGVERLLRDAKVTQIFDGTTDVLATRIGRRALTTAW